MGLFGKKAVDEKTFLLNNELLSSLKVDSTTGEMVGVSKELDSKDAEKIELVMFQVFELIKQLKEAEVFSKKAVHRFVKDNHNWVDTTSIEKLIEIGMY